MKKIFLIVMLLFTANTVSAEQIPIKIYPAQDISTCYDQIETGDKILFRTDTNRTYDYPSLKLKPNSQVIGIVDYVQENGWLADNAQIQFKKFIIPQKNGNDIITYSNLTIDGFEELKYRYPKIKRIFEYISVIPRGKEVDIRSKKDKSVYNIWVKL